MLITTSYPPASNPSDTPQTIQKQSDSLLGRTTRYITVIESDKLHCFDVDEISEVTEVFVPTT